MDKKLADMTLEEAWQLAIRREQEAQELYRQLAEKSPEMRDLFTFLLLKIDLRQQKLVPVLGTMHVS